MEGGIGATGAQGTAGASGAQGAARTWCNGSNWSNRFKMVYLGNQEVVGVTTPPSGKFYYDSSTTSLYINKTDSLGLDQTTFLNTLMIQDKHQLDLMLLYYLPIIINKLCMV